TTASRFFAIPLTERNHHGCTDCNHARNREHNADIHSKIQAAVYLGSKISRRLWSQILSRHLRHNLSVNRGGVNHESVSFLRQELEVFLRLTGAVDDFFCHLLHCSRNGVGGVISFIFLPPFPFNRFWLII